MIVRYLSQNSLANLLKKWCVYPFLFDTFAENGKQVVCEDCNKRFTHKRSLLLHRQTAHSKDGPKRFSCDLCDKSFTRKQYFNAHKLKHAGMFEIFFIFFYK